MALSDRQERIISEVVIKQLAWRLTKVSFIAEQNYCSYFRLDYCHGDHSLPGEALITPSVHRGQVVATIALLRDLLVFLAANNKTSKSTYWIAKLLFAAYFSNAVFQDIWLQFSKEQFYALDTQIR